MTPQQYATAQAKVEAAAKRDWAAWLRANPQATQRQAKARFLYTAHRYGAAAAQTAIAYYQDVRGDLGDGWRPEAFGGFPASYVAKAFDAAYRPDTPGGGVAGRLGQFVQEPGRNTIKRNTRRDPSGMKWARMPMSAKPCAWCLMLASQGAVYLTRQSAGKLKSGAKTWGHDNCNCQPQLIKPGQPLPYDADRLLAIYHQAREAAGPDASLGAIAKAARRLFPDIVSDGARQGDPPDSDRIAWRKRQDALPTNRIADNLEPHEIRFYEQFIPARNVVELIPRDTSVPPPPTEGLSETWCK